jgi:hypothetical protein
MPITKLDQQPSELLDHTHLSVLVEQELGLNPFASALYVFTNRHHCERLSISV